MNIRPLKRLYITTFSSFSTVFLITACLVLVTCGKDSTTKPAAPEPPPPATPAPPPPAPVPTRITITPSSVSLNSVGQTMPLTAKVFDQNNAVLGSATVSWSSSDEGVATVGSRGLVTAVSNGTATITASSGIASATAAVTVMQSASRIVLESSSATLVSLGETVQLTATVQDANGQAVDGAAVTWSSSDEGVATVGAQGLVTAVSNGSATITARSGSVSATAAVTVMQTAHGIVLEPQMATLTRAGETVQLAAAVLDLNEQPVDGATVSWASSDPGVAAVDDDGLVTAVANGSAGITASYGDISATARIEVEIADPGDRDALIALYVALDGPNWTYNTNWLSDLPLGEWYGVGTDDTGRVTWLSLAFNELSGAIPSELGNLAKLEELNLSQNRLSCVIPPELGNLTNLYGLYLYSIPILPAVFPPEWDPVPDPACRIPAELGNLTNLEELRLGLRTLSGRIPAELGNLTNLQVLDLRFNALSGGVPPELGKLPNLYSLNLGFNALSGSIPAELGNLANLMELNLTLNALSGSIPPELGNLAGLEVLELGLNALSGSVPPELGNLSELTYLSLVYNEDLSGPLPATFTNLNYLEGLDLSYTGLCVPPEPAFRAWLERFQAADQVVYCGGMQGG